MSNKAVDLGLTPATTSRPARLKGYPSFAQFIARDSDAAIYRKYSHLSARNLLYLQSDLHALEEQLQQLDREDAKHIDNENAQNIARKWEMYSDTENARASQHRLLQEKIKTRIKEYRKYRTYLPRDLMGLWLTVIL